MLKRSLAVCAALALWVSGALHGACAANEPAKAEAPAVAEPGLIVPPSAPRAAQIEPFVAPVKRSAPQTPVTAVKSKPATATKQGACGSNKKRANGDKCVTVAEDGGAKKPAKKKISAP